MKIEILFPIRQSSSRVPDAKYSEKMADRNRLDIYLVLFIIFEFKQSRPAVEGSFSPSITLSVPAGDIIMSDKGVKLWSR